MIESIRFVIKEHKQNLYKIYLISRYEYISESKEAYLGWLWNIISPFIQIFTYWFVFGIGIRNSKPVNGIPFFQWMLPGILVWFFMSSCIKKGTNAIYSKLNILKKMKFPVSILPTTVVLTQFFDHCIMLFLTVIIMLFQGFRFSLLNIFVFYYTISAIIFCISFALLFSILNIITRDVKKFVDSTIRMLFYLTPILWTTENLPQFIKKIIKFNPIFYIVDGYRRALFLKFGSIIPIEATIVFWIITIVMFVCGCILIYKYRYKIVDLA